MGVMQFLGGAAIIIVFLSVIIGWLIYLILWVKCRKKKTCDKKNCIFRLHCTSPYISKEEELRLRKMMIEHNLKDKENEGK